MRNKDENKFGTIKKVAHVRASVIRLSKNQRIEIGLYESRYSDCYEWRNIYGGFECGVEGNTIKEAVEKAKIAWSHKYFEFNLISVLI